MKRKKPKTYEAEIGGRKVRVTIPDDYDAYEERTLLAHALAAWKTAGYWPTRKADWWYRRVRRLARSCRMPLSKVMADLERDAEAILDEGADPLVDASCACPSCGERRMDELAWDDDGEWIQCQTCSRTYKPEHHQ
jgi:hypothetical protein